MRAPTLRVPKAASHLLRDLAKNLTFLHCMPEMSNRAFLIIVIKFSSESIEAKAARAVLFVALHFIDAVNPCKHASQDVALESVT